MSAEDFITNLVRTADGRLAVDAASQVSYPEDGHEICHAVEEHSFWFRHRNAVICSAVSRFRPAPRLPFLDVGGGNGFVARAIADLGHDVVVLEPGAAGASAARARGLEVVEASIVDAQVREQSLGGIGLFDVLEHIEDDVEALRRLRTMLAPDGRLYLTVPSHRWLWTHVDEASGHFRRYTRRSLVDTLERAGFEVDFASYYFWPLPVPMFLLRVLPERLGRARPDRAERVSREHGHSGGLLRRALDWELGRLGSGPLRVGASCVAVATPKDSRTS